MTPRYSRSLFVVIDYGGIGLGLISDDVLWSNRSGLGEFGHIVIDYNGRPCECGRFGCSPIRLRPGNARPTGRAFRRSTPGIGMAQLARMAEQGDSTRNGRSSTRAYCLGYGVTDIDCIVHPEFIVLGSLVLT